MLEKFQSIIKFVNKEVVFLVIGIVIGVLLSGALKMHLRNQCIIETLKIISNIHDDKDINLLNVDSYIKKVDVVCGKL